MTGAATLFEAVFGKPHTITASAPGRVNLIGEHTDYNAGLVLPFAIDRRAVVAAAPRDDGTIRVCSDRRPDEIHEIPVYSQTPGAVDGWPAYVVGVAWALRKAGHQVGGADLAVSSSVPVGAGLSSSAALECAAALAFADMYHISLHPSALARIAQRDENEFVGIPCGLMDQMASSAAAAGTLLYFDVGADHTELVPFDLAPDDLTMLVVDTRVHHEIGDGQYADRRRQCEQAAGLLGLDNLSQLATDDLDDALRHLPEDVLRRRTRHVVTENGRVRDVVAALRADRIREIAPFLTASHASLRDDFEVSCAELDLAVNVAQTSGAFGARMTGGGFGGSAIALVDRRLAGGLGDDIVSAFAHAGYTVPALFTVTPSAGARIEAPSALTGTP